MYVSTFFPSVLRLLLVPLYPPINNNVSDDPRGRVILLLRYRLIDVV